MLCANLPMFCSSSIASRCCRLQPLSFTGFLKGYFIACRYHSLGLYGLCSPLALSRRRSLRLHLRSFLFWVGTKPPSTIRISSLCLPPLSDSPYLHKGGCHCSSSMSLRYKLAVSWVNTKFRQTRIMLQEFCYLSGGFYYTNAYWKEMAMFHLNNVIKLIMIY